MEPGQRRRYLGQVAYPADPDRITSDLFGAQAPPELLQAVARLDDRMYMDTDDVERALDEQAQAEQPERT